MPYQYQYTIPFTSSDPEGRMTIPACIDLFQDAANRHTDAVVPEEHRAASSRVWILNYWHLVFDQPLLYNETVTLSTWSAGYERMFAHRCYEVKNAMGETDVRAVSYWFLVDQKRKRPVRITEDDIKWYESEPALDLGEEVRRIDLPEVMELQESVKICRYMIDGYQHVNNAWYVRIASEYFPEGKPIRELRASYLSEAHYGDTFYPATAQVDNHFYVALNNADGKPHAVIEVIF